ncbi:hypothetical protein ADIAL_1311 [Alkalibacterium sp. AK22]|uniref:hypothetical protein n=1 Tax=Alkalibacterium sp. AK22 TaxID=1229520 RepID=UPI0004451215|nr:hypothetical protein [Alkalibacterium sp. AK22]EXJ23164.1 hypothetical protein ADIAL_1311 [Alkalibacterium sp. AK22]
MTRNEGNQSMLAATVEYKYIIQCKEQTIELEVDDRDVFYNADDEIDCPLDVVLRKNQYSLNDLMKWDARKVQFVKIIDTNVHVINSVHLNVNL